MHQMLLCSKGTSRKDIDGLSGNTCCRDRRNSYEGNAGKWSKGDPNEWSDRLRSGCHLPKSANKDAM